MVMPKVLVFLMEKIYGPETEIKKDEISHVWKEKLIQTQTRLRFGSPGNACNSNRSLSM